MSTCTKTIASVSTGDKSLAYQRMFDAFSAAKLLERHLGETVEHWIEYLQQDRAEAFASSDECGIPYVHREGEYYYAEADLYGYVRLHNPTALALDVTETGRSFEPSSTFECSVHVDVDFVHRGRLMVHLFTTKTCEAAHPWLTPEAARALAQQLTDAADECELYEYDFLAGALRRRGVEASCAQSELAAAERVLHVVQGGVR